MQRCAGDDADSCIAENRRLWDTQHARQTGHGRVACAGGIHVIRIEPAAYAGSVQVRIAEQDWPRVIPVAERRARNREYQRLTGAELIDRRNLPAAESA